MAVGDSPVHEPAEIKYNFIQNVILGSKMWFDKFSTSKYVKNCELLGARLAYGLLLLLDVHLNGHLVFFVLICIHLC